MIILCGSSFILYFNQKIPLLYRRTFLIGVYASIALTITFLLLTNSGAAAHIDGLKTGILSGLEHPFGLGLGNAGNFTSFDDNASTESVGRESMIGTMLGQIGLIGFIPYLMFIITSISALVKGYILNKNKNIELAKLSLATAGAFLGYTINSMFTDSASGVTGNFYYFLFLGLVITQLHKPKERV